MAQMIVRNVDEGVAKRFKAKAKAKGKSAEQLLRDLLEREVGPSVEENLRELDAIRETTRGKQVLDPVETIRHDRDTDHGRI